MSDYDRIVTILRGYGERMTIQRRMVIEALLDTRTHMTVNDVSQHITTIQKSAPVAEPTIYRILQWLKDLKLVSQTDLSESGVVYEIIDNHKHHHLVCLICGNTTDIPDSLFDHLRTQVREKYNFQPRIDHMAIYGYCDDCDPSEDD